MHFSLAQHGGKEPYRVNDTSHAMIVGVFLNASLSLRQWNKVRRFNPQD